MHVFSSQYKVGILGGGQLGKMLLYNTRKFDIYTCVLDPNPDAPCKLACNEFFVGDLMDFDTVFEFGKKVDTLTIEIENVNVDALDALEKEGIKVYPSDKKEANFDFDFALNEVAPFKSSSFQTARIPFPPPPAEALIKIGYLISFAIALAF